MGDDGVRAFEERMKKIWLKATYYLRMPPHKESIGISVQLFKRGSTERTFNIGQSTRADPKERDTADTVVAAGHSSWTQHTIRILLSLPR